MKHPKDLTGLKYGRLRKNVNGDYCLENCTWITIQDQQWNRRDNKGRDV